ncbi:hypothetical protein [Verrucosispora sp. WMMC514]|uniref:WD40/YVTN/BNR-like repeat-containing protein n=1 Tax=Verrucosispora sp. WMMC514 TaxID=3015156 RepID=UPI00248CC954|nr:hypothetical protein [Verrucosispora sp. WMMC514]WBB93603.1 hypothetical protein O7597_11840 [Verrucosispora sp. WMMC514]
MREINLDQLFADFEATSAPTFRPPDISDLQRRMRRRRSWRSLLTGLVVLLLTGPGVYATAGLDADRDPPDPTPSPPPDGQVIERKVDPVGVAGSLSELRFVDARHGWALFDTCERTDDSSDCRRDLARTVDGGETWQRIPVPDAVNRPRQEWPVHLLAVDERIVTISIGGGYLVSTDGGATFTEHPQEAPPEATLLSWATRSGYLLRCPGSDPLTRVDCPELALARIGAATPPTQPPVALSRDANLGLVEDGDGRLWVTVLQDDRLRTAVGADGAASWRQLPAVSGADKLLVSPDGRDAWLLGRRKGSNDLSDLKRIWRLVDDRWREQTELPSDTNSVTAVNDGMLVVTKVGGNLGYWTGERYIDVPEVRGPRFEGEELPSIEVLPDDTIVIYTRNTTTTLGVGTGQSRAWIRLNH